VDPGQLRQAEASYKAELRAAIEANKRYPAMARRLRREGRVVVRFVVHADGRISDIAVAQGSGTRILDRAALRAVKAVGTFRPFPEEFRESNKRFRIAMRFRLR